MVRFYSNFISTVLICLRIFRFKSVVYIIDYINMRFLLTKVNNTFNKFVDFYYPIIKFQSINLVHYFIFRDKVPGVYNLIRSISWKETWTTVGNVSLKLDCGGVIKSYFARRRILIYVWGYPPSNIPLLSFQFSRVI